MIKNIFKVYCLFILFGASAQYENFKSGDLIFQSSRSGQSMAIQLATHSKYTHVGVLMEENGKWYVYEAVQPVKKTALQSWINRGDDHHYVVKRVDTVISSEALLKMQSYLKNEMGKDYDIYFNWSDEELYCSELAWKAYQNIGIQICPLKALSTFDLSHPLVKAKLKERYGKNIPMEEKVVAPSDLFESKKMMLIAKD